MNLSDEQVRELILSTGFKPGDPMSDDVARAWINAAFDRGRQESIKVCLEIAARYKPVYRFGVDPMDIPEHMAKVTAENCARQIEHKFSDPVDVADEAEG